MRQLILAGLLALGLSACGGEEPRKEFTIGVTQFPSNFHPLIDSMMAKTYINGMTRRPLVAFGSDWKPLCMLCTDLPTIENGLAIPETTPEGKGGIAVTFSLREGLTWGDGTPVTSEDFRFAWEVGKHPDSGVDNGEFFRRILDIDIKDPRTFTLHVDRIEFDYNVIALQPLPNHLEREVFEKNPATYRTRSLFETEPANPGLHFGPYRIAKVARGSHVVLERNQYWKGKKPSFPLIAVKAVENTAALEANLLSGDVDMIAGELGLLIDQVLAFEERHGADYQVTYKPGLIYEHLDVNLENPILADVRVRQALMYAMDRETLTAELFKGKQPVAHGNVNPLDWVYAEDTPRYVHDLAKAAALLEEAGWHLGEDGLRKNDKGKVLEIVLMSTAGNRSRELVEQVLQSQWREAGIKVTIRNEPARVFFGETTARRAFPGLAMFTWISSPESVPRTTLHSTMIPTKKNNWAGQNFTGYANPEMDGLIDQIEVELNRERRRALWNRLQHLYAQDIPALPLYFRANSYILPKGMSGVEPTGHQYPTTLWVENWKWKP